jgi:ribonuclease-3
MTDAALAARIGHAFRDPALLDRALTHRSSADAGRSGLGSNERLEFLGDRVLGLLIAELLAERFPREREGALGRRLSVLVSAPTLAAVGEAIGIGPALKVPKAAGKAGLREEQNVVADATEAVIGALYLDGGLDAARRFVHAEWAAHIAADPTPPVNAKSRLQEYLLGRGLPLPQYRVLSAEGPDHKPLFTIEVLAEGRAAQASGESKQAAQQAAAEAWLAGCAG